MEENNKCLKYYKVSAYRNLRNLFRLLKKGICRSCKIFYCRNLEKYNSVNYLHVLGHCELKFNKSLVDEINRNEFPFNNKEHLFITPHWDVYFALRQYKNVFYVDKWNARELNRLSYLGKWIFIHALNFNEYERSMISEEVAPRIIWRTWGHDITNYPRAIVNEKNTTQKIILEKAYMVIKQFYAIGGGNDVDLININESIGRVKYFRMPYSFDIILDEFKVEKKSENRSVRILVGHYASRGDRLLECLTYLRKFKEKAIKIYLITSYADNDKEYVNLVRKYARENYGEKVIFIDKFLPKIEYVRFLQSIDIAIMDQMGSAALGNIAWLLYFDKKIFLNRKGILKKAFEMHNLVYSFTDEIESMSYEEFIKPVKNSQESKKDIQFHDKTENLECWNKIFKEIENSQKVCDSAGD